MPKYRQRRIEVEAIRVPNKKDYPDLEEYKKAFQAIEDWSGGSSGWSRVMPIRLNFEDGAGALPGDWIIKFGQATIVLSNADFRKAFELVV